MSEQHIHYNNMQLFLKDAAVSETPWIHWQFLSYRGWEDLSACPRWDEKTEYRRKPEKVVINGFSVEQNLHNETSIDSSNRVYIEAPSEEGFVIYAFCKEREIKRGIVHKTLKSAVHTCKARLGIDPDL